MRALEPRNQASFSLFFCQYRVDHIKLDGERADVRVFSLEGGSRKGNFGLGFLFAEVDDRNFTVSFCGAHPGVVTNNIMVLHVMSVRRSCSIHLSRVPKGVVIQSMSLEKPPPSFLPCRVFILFFFFALLSYLTRREGGGSCAFLHVSSRCYV